MKTIFKEITARLEAEVPELRWIDKEKGQMNFSTAVLFPAALITLSTKTRNNITDTWQEKDLVVQVKLCFDFSGNTNNKTPQLHRDKSLEYYDVCEKVHKALQGWGGSTFNPLASVGHSPIPRPDGYVTEVMSYQSSYRDDVAL
ncbi:hypothetical protein Q4603_05740 [Zobellia galactanivorans]|uniref:hypothetical protein n=1 Tax=Zobellia galactanivorans (strain DSM 12802 / CCUG 47099 / CIP 106680 / NCIMB 13871 / Dsij) TaxID=63186 RepID=UPI0026E13172|nr:hypothetical protein [Zobellia galactanivorans]MDO6808097.1 hypothetical protein [Zobellia galactanivorans]